MIYNRIKRNVLLIIRVSLDAPEFRNNGKGFAYLERLSSSIYLRNWNTKNVLHKLSKLTEHLKKFFISNQWSSDSIPQKIQILLLESFEIDFNVFIRRCSTTKNILHHL